MKQLRREISTLTQHEVEQVWYRVRAKVWREVVSQTWDSVEAQVDDLILESMLGEGQIPFSR